MQSSEVLKLFIYTDALTNRVLLTKRSSGADFFLLIDGVKTYCLQSTEPLPAPEKFESAYLPASGVQILGTPPTALAPSLHLLRQKCEIAVLILTSISFIESEMKQVFSSKAVRQYPIKESLFKLYEKFMREERLLLRSRIDRFRHDFFIQLNHLSTRDQLDDYHEKLRFNLNIGVYSVTNRERKKIGIAKL